MAALDFFDPRTALFPYNRFMEFIAPRADRYSIISSVLDEAGLNSLVLPIAGNRHFLILPPGESIREGRLPFRGRNPVILTAHYDRFPGSSGANDNSAAVFQLIVTARKLVSEKQGFWMIFFTDKEELGEGESIEDQGAYGLASTLRSGGLADARIYVFDACGTGDTIIISTAADTLLKNEERAPFL
ncbi:MAG: M28 family peptidase, partial [Treponema sp.]|nr:M28 family peptidase [Treponema sp.]